MSRESFTNRRGHELRIRDEELTGLHIDEQPAAAPVAALPVDAGANRVRPRSVSQRKARQVPWWRRWYAIGLAVLVVALAVVLGVGEALRAHYIADAQVDERVVAAGRASLEGQEDRYSRPISELATLHAQLCAGGFRDNLASLYSRAQQGLEQCREARGKLGVMIERLKTMESQQAYLDKLTAILKPVASPPDAQFAVLSAQIDHWKSIGKKLDGLSIPRSFDTAHQRLVDQASGIHKGWVELQASSAAQDAERFSAARDGLGERYGGLQAVHEEFSRVVARSQSELTESYDAIANP